MTDKKDVYIPVKEEAEKFHQFLEDWISGKLTNNDLVLSEQFGDRLGEGFEITTAKGFTLNKESFVKELVTQHGSNTRLRIAIRNVQIRQVIKDSKTPPNHARVCSAWFKQDHKSGRLTWFHLQETRMPLTLCPAEKFNFDADEQLDDEPAVLC